MRRRSFLGSPLLAQGLGLRAQQVEHPFARVLDNPDRVTAYLENGAVSLQRSGNQWQSAGLELMSEAAGERLRFVLHAPDKPCLRVHARWQLSIPLDLEYLGDHWERSYGDLAWRKLEPERILPWYFLASCTRGTAGCGVKTGPAALCFWQVDPEGVSLWLDVRNGGSGVVMGDRQLVLATVVSTFYPGLGSFEAATKFCASMCDRPRLPSAPVYGGNNWYYAYGKSSAADIRADSERIASMSTDAANRPWMVIDDGWAPNATCGPFTRGNERFPDMAGLAADMRRIGVQPGIWTRPLFTKDDVSPRYCLHSPNAENEWGRRKSYTLDPTVEGALEKVRGEVSLMRSWGYALIKHDFSTYDLFGRWGFSMGAEITSAGWSFADRSRTSAEIVIALYEAIRSAAGDALLLGCNTMGHLGAGHFEVQRTGDDTSGRDWNRTRKMGVNTLAFRMPQHNKFFAVDADCVGLTRQIPWTYNRQWLDLLSRSGTPLFVSASPDALGDEQRRAVREAFAVASLRQTAGEPEDWQSNAEPCHWSLAGKHRRYDWFGTDGSSPLAT